MGVVGYRTPNIDRIPQEGAIFTDYYAEQSCIAGRSTFIRGQSTLRTGLSKVGLPGAPIGLQANDLTIASALRDKGYATALKSLDDMGIANNTIVVYTTDNGPHENTWPDAANSPYRNEKTSNWKGAHRVPAMVRWPGHIKQAIQLNGIFSGMDWFPTLLAATGDTDITQRLLNGTTIDGEQYKNHLDGFNQLDHLTGKSPDSARHEFLYFNDDGDLVGLRYENWKLVFEEQRAPGTMQVWAESFVKLRLSKMFDLHADPYEKADITSNTYWDWVFTHAYLAAPAQAEVAICFRAIGAGEGNRTLVFSLGSCCSTIELHPRCQTEFQQFPAAVKAR